MIFKVTYQDRAINKIVKLIEAETWSDVLPLAFSVDYKKVEWKLISIQAIREEGPDKGEPFDREKWLEDIRITCEEGELHEKE